MVLTVKEFNKLNEETIVQDCIKETEKALDQQILAYAKADYRTRRKISENIMNALDRHDNLAYVAFLDIPHDDKLAPKIESLTADQRDYYRRAITQSYGLTGWHIWGYYNESLQDISNETYYGNCFPAIVIAPRENINNIIIRIK